MLLRSWFAQSTSDEAKKLLSANTNKALEEGAFGLPWFVGMHSSSDRPLPSRLSLLTVAATNADGKKECYWGFDHFGMVVEHLGLERPMSGTANEPGWRAML